MMDIHARLFAIIATVMALSFSTQAATNTFNVTATLDNTTSYTINGAANPDLTLVRGFTYTFNIDATSFHPFWIKTVQSTGTGNAYNDGLSTNGIYLGTIVFSVPTNAPNPLYYDCQFHTLMTGQINIIDPPTVTITGVNVGTNVVLQSTGSDTLDLNVLTSTNLSTNTAWTSASILNNTYVNGTNTTQIARPSGQSVFMQVQQGFF